MLVCLWYHTTLFNSKPIFIISLFFFLYRLLHLRQHKVDVSVMETMVSAWSEEDVVATSARQIIADAIEGSKKPSEAGGEHVDKDDNTDEVSPEGWNNLDPDSANPAYITDTDQDDEDEWATDEDKTPEGDSDEPEGDEEEANKDKVAGVDS